MANVWIEESTMTAIGDAIRDKTGSAELILPADMPEAISSITGGGGGSVTDIIPETTLPFAPFENGVYGFEVPDSSMYTISEGATYVVVWDGRKYECVCKPLTVEAEGQVVSIGYCIGNASIGGIAFGVEGWEDSGEPFAIASITTLGIVVGTMSTDQTHVLRVYVERQAVSELVKYVTFMNEDGTKELYTKPTITGDDCVDVVAKGLLETPTKTSSAQYNYTYNGWSLEQGGSANSDALKNVTEDRVVYATFTASVRSYTITYNDTDGSFLYSETLAYGTMPSYKPEKSGSSFDCWEPALAMVSGDATYVAKWVETVTFATGSWSDIAQIAEAGEAPKYFALGDTRDIPYNGGTMTVEIVGFDHDDLSDGSGKAGLSIVCTKTSNNKTKFYTGSDTSENRYNKSNLHSVLQTEVFGYLPEDLRAVIKSVDKQYVTAPAKPSAGGKTIATISEKVFVPSMNELNIKSSVPSGINMVLGTEYQKYVQSGVEAVTALPMDGSTAYSYWLRDENITSNGNYWTNTSQVRVLKSGAKYSLSLSSSYEFFMRFGFCI